MDTEEIKALLLSKRHLNEISGCWVWTGHVIPYNYGGIKIGGKNLVIHRVAYEAWIGPIPDGHVCRHKCDNPRCFNPDHLNTGSQRENNLDCVRSGRHAEASKTHCKWGHEFTPANTRINGKGHRLCIECRKRNNRRSRPEPRRDRLTHCKKGHERTPENTYKEPNGGIKCRECMRLRMSQRRKRVMEQMKTNPFGISVRQAPVSSI